MKFSVEGATLDDLLRDTLESVLQVGISIEPTKGAAIDITGARLELTNPLARLSRSETRGRLFSCLGELCWYLGGTNSVDWIAYYISHYSECGENGYVHGGYGPRLFGGVNGNQIDYVISKLRAKPASRQAVIQIFDKADVQHQHLDIPCTCTLQFVVREQKLHLITYMRSNDVHLGLPHDVFAFTMIQELIARSVEVEVGTYIHMVGSLHLYEKNREASQRFLNEGWHSNVTMPAMPLGDQWENIRNLLDVEKYLREGGDPFSARFSIDPYWADLERILAIYALEKTQRRSDVASLSDQFHSDIYTVFVKDRLGKEGTS